MIDGAPVIQVVKWGEFQHYKDRSPPWIKLHRKLIHNRKWHELSGDASKLLAECWLLASETDDGTIPLATADLAWRTRREPDDTREWLQELERQGFVDLSRHDASTALSEGLRLATPEGEGETEKTDTSKPEIPVSDLWVVFLEELGGEGRKPTLTPKRRTKLKALYTEQLKDEPDPSARFRKLLQTVKASDHHMSQRTYQMPESLFRSPERRDRWMQMSENGSGPSAHWSEKL